MKSTCCFCESLHGMLSIWSRRHDTVGHNMLNTLGTLCVVAALLCCRVWVIWVQTHSHTHNKRMDASYIYERAHTVNDHHVQMTSVSKRHAKPRPCARPTRRRRCYGWSNIRITNTLTHSAKNSSKTKHMYVLCIYYIYAQQPSA